VRGRSQPKGFTPDGEGVAILCDHQAIRFLDAATGQDRGEIQAADAPPGGRWFDCVIAVQARKLFAGGEDGEKRGFVGGWNLTPPERR
jgi:hypothetical protein